MDAGTSGARSKARRTRHPRRSPAPGDRCSDPSRTHARRASTFARDDSRRGARRSHLGGAAEPVPARARCRATGSRTSLAGQRPRCPGPVARRTPRSVTKPGVTDEQARPRCSPSSIRPRRPGRYRVLREGGPDDRGPARSSSPTTPVPGPSNPPAGGAPHAEASRLGPALAPVPFAVTRSRQPAGKLHASRKGPCPRSLSLLQGPRLNPTARKPGEGSPNTPPADVHLCTTEVRPNKRGDAVPRSAPGSDWAQVMPPSAADDERPGRAAMDVRSGAPARRRA